VFFSRFPVVTGERVVLNKITLPMSYGVRHANGNKIKLRSRSPAG
jgi:hypothetical protein